MSDATLTSAPPTTSPSTAMGPWTDADHNAVRILTVLDWIVTSFFLASLIYRFERGRRKFLIAAALLCEQIIWVQFSQNRLSWAASDVFAFLFVRLFVGWYGYLKILDIVVDLIQKGSFRKIVKVQIYLSFAIYTVSEIMFAAFRSLYASIGFIVGLSIYVHVIMRIRKYPDMPITVERIHGIAGSRIALSVLTIVIYGLVHSDAIKGQQYYKDHVPLVLIFIMYNVVLKWMTITGTGYTIWDLCCSKGDTKFQFDPNAEMGEAGDNKGTATTDNPYDV